MGEGIGDKRALAQKEKRADGARRETKQSRADGHKRGIVTGLQGQRIDQGAHRAALVRSSWSMWVVASRPP